MRQPRRGYPLSPGRLVQIAQLIDYAERNLGRLTEGQRADLILDNFAEIPSSLDAHAILSVLETRA